MQGGNDQGTRSLNVTADELRSVPWEARLPSGEVLEGWRGQLYAYAEVLLRESEKASQSGDEGSARVYRVLGSLAQLRLQLDVEDVALTPSTNDPALGLPSIDSFPPATVEALRETIPGVENAEMKARLADVVATCSRDYLDALAAVEAYLDASAKAWEHSRWATSLLSLERALKIGIRFGRNAEAYPKAASLLLEFTERAQQKEPLEVLDRVLLIALKYSEGDPTKAAAAAEWGAKQAEEKQEWDLARNLWDGSADWHRRAGDESASQAARVRVAETHEREASDVLSGEGDMRHVLSRNAEVSLD